MMSRFELVKLAAYMVGAVGFTRQHCGGERRCWKLHARRPYVWHAWRGNAQTRAVKVGDVVAV